MKPLVYWARWHDARIRLHGRDAEAVWGEFDFWKEGRRVPFRYQLNKRVLTLEENGEGQTGREIELDEMGVERQA